MNKVNVKFITRTAVLLALTVVFQAIGRYIPLGPNSNFVVGPLVNACLLISAASVGSWGASVIAVAAPFGAILTGAAVPLPFAPFIAVGNFLIVLAFYLIMRRNRIIAVLAGSVLKFVFLYASVIFFARAFQVPAKKAAAMYFAFGWPQLVTALIGGAIALAVINSLGSKIELHD